MAIQQSSSPVCSATRATTVAIVSPFEIWAAGLAANVANDTIAIVECWASLEEALASGDLADCDVLVISDALFERPQGASYFRPLADDFDGRIVAVVEPNSAFSVEDFIALDVEGLVLSSARIEDLNECLAHVVAGSKWVGTGIRDLLRQTRIDETRVDQLSNRERQVAELAAMGLSNKAIARELNVSDGTVKMHMHHVLSKLNICSRLKLTL